MRDMDLAAQRVLRGDWRVDIFYTRCLVEILKWLSGSKFKM